MNLPTKDELAEAHRQRIDNLADACSKAGERIKELVAAESRAYQMLQHYGVPPERAGSVHNGIDVLATRWRRAGQDLMASVSRRDAILRRLLKWWEREGTDAAKGIEQAYEFSSIISAAQAEIGSESTGEELPK